MSNSFVDPVVAEIHEIRDQMLAAAGGNIDILIQQVAERQNRSGRVIIRDPLPKRTEQTVAVVPSNGPCSSGESTHAAH